MIVISNTDELTKILRNILIAQSELPADRVLNALSVQGTELDKLLEESSEEYVGIDQQNTTMLFELMPTRSTSNVSMEEGDFYTGAFQVCSPYTIASPETIVGDRIIDKSITYYKMYMLKVIVYGLNSSSNIVTLVSRLRSLAVRQKLYSSGVYLESVEEPEEIHEFINDTMWLRNDITINIGVKFSIPQHDESDVDYDYQSVGALKIIRRK